MLKAILCGWIARLDHAIDRALTDVPSLMIPGSEKLMSRTPEANCKDR